MGSWGKKPSGGTWYGEAILKVFCGSTLREGRRAGDGGRRGRVFDGFGQGSVLPFRGVAHGKMSPKERTSDQEEEFVWPLYRVPTCSCIKETFRRNTLGVGPTSLAKASGKQIAL